MGTVADRLKVIIGNRSNSEFARSISVREGTVRSWLTGASLPGAEALMEIQRVHGYSIDWILTGSASQKTDGSQKNDLVSVATEGADEDQYAAIQRLKVTASAGAGAFNSATPEVESVRIPAWVLRRLGLKAASARVISSRGISMMPTIGDGDLLVVDVSKDHRIPTDGLIYVLSIDNELLVKRLRQSSSGWILVSDNREMYPEEPIRPDASVKIHGQVRWVDRKLS